MAFREHEMDFREVDRRYAGLKRQHEAGTIGDEEFDDQLKQMMVQDDQDRWWAKSRKTGEWHYHDGEAWVRGTPPGYEPSPSLPDESAPERQPLIERSPSSQATIPNDAPVRDEREQRRGVPRWTILVVGLVGLATLAGIGIFAIMGGEGAPPEEEVSDLAPGYSGTPASAPDCPVFPADNVWHADVSGLPVHSRSADWISSMGGPDARLHPDFGPSDEGMPYGIPYNVVDGDHSKVQVTWDGPDGIDPEESDPGPYPFDADTRIEGGPDSDGDRHAIMVDRDNCMLYELYHANWNGGDPTADQGSVFDLRSNDLRPDGWTSADGAGLPIFAGLLRPDEVASGDVDHAIRVAASQTDMSYLWPARHQAGARSDPTLPPMGARFRLKADFDTSGFRPDTQAILQAMKEHGLIVADNGSDWFFTGTAEDGWENDMLDELKSIPAGEFEAVDASSVMADSDSGRVVGSVPW